MSKFKVGDHVRVTFPKHSQFDRAGNVIEVFDEDTESAAVYRVRFPGVMVKQLCERDLTLADPDVHTVLDQMDAESALPQADLAPHLDAIEKSQAEWDAMVTPDPVSAPSHYRSHPSGIECIQVTEHMGFNLGSATKYLWRCDLKENAIQDLEKAVWYIQREIAKRKSAQ